MKAPETPDMKAPETPDMKPPETRDMKPPETPDLQTCPGQSEYVNQQGHEFVDHDSF